MFAFQLFFVTLRTIKQDEELVYWVDDPNLMWTRKRAEKKSKHICLPSITMLQMQL